MKNKKALIKVFLLFTILLIISVAVIIIKGDTYEIRPYYRTSAESVDDLIITVEDENVVKVKDAKIENGAPVITVESVSKGKTFVQVKNILTGKEGLDIVYVHNFGVISYNEFMGNMSYSKIIPVSISIFLIYILYLLISSYKRNSKENMYQYKNIVYLGVIVFLTFVVLSQIFSIFKYKGLITTVNQIANMFSFTMITLPVAFITSILVIVSNISLLRKEGFNLKNMLGIILGGFLCLMSILPEIMYKLLYSSTLIDIHNQNGLGLYLYNSTESMLKIIIVYIECILIGTIVMATKAAKHVPEFDKDAIIILGCKIKKDGTLTNLLKGRVDRAIEFAKMQKENTGKSILFVPSGGKGQDEVISEGDAMRNYMLEQGISEKDILVDNKSKNTYENIKFSNQIIKEKIENAKIAFSTTNYHVFRAGCIATEQSIKVDGIGSKTKTYFWVNAFIREFIATLVNERKKHIIVFLSILVVNIILIYITYLNNNC